jgi:cytochrome c biogenesis protein CcdA
MTLTLVRSEVRVRQWRRGVWVKISISLIVAGIIALGSAVGIGIHWYYNLNTLHTEGTARVASVSMVAGGSHVIDERVSTSTGYQYLVDVRSVSVRVRMNTANATVDVETCPIGGGTPGAVASLGYSTCAAPVPFHAGGMSLGSERLLVRVTAIKPGKVVIDGVDVAYKSGIRHTTQHVGPVVTIEVHS